VQEIPSMKVLIQIESNTFEGLKECLEQALSTLEDGPDPDQWICQVQFTFKGPGEKKALMIIELD
jgi:hypothetical protein